MDGNEGSHDHCRLIKNKFLKEGQSKAQWVKLFLKVNSMTEELSINKDRVLDFAMQSALTYPQCLDGWNKGKPEENIMTAAWTSTYTLYLEELGRPLE
jgi:hypothetical protein